MSAQELGPGVLTLKHIRDGVGQALARLPDCMCVETVDRFWKPAGAGLRPPDRMDRVVLQILFSGDKELFASPGDTRWETDPKAFLASGLIGNGIFALFLHTVFLNNVSVIQYKGEETVAGRREVRYDFSISSLSSGYMVHRGSASGIVAMRGSFWADPQTYDLRRLEFHGEQIPPALLYTDIVTTISYGRVRIGGRDVLLPQTAVVRTTDADGEGRRNDIEFTHCQGFATESTLSFGAEPGPVAGQPKTPAPPPPEGTVPAGLHINIALSAPLGEDAAVGSLLEGRVVGAVLQKGKVLIPDGAAIKGRLRRLEGYSDAGDYFVVALEFTRIETPAANLRFYAELQGLERLEGVEMSHQTSSTTEGEFVAPGQSAKWSMTDKVSIWTHEVPGVGTFFVRGSQLSLPAGFRTVWTTLPYPKSAKQ
jgi:hypothetical protein